MSTRPPSRSRWSRPGRARLADLAQHLVLLGRRRVGRVRHAGERRVELLLAPSRPRACSSFTFAATPCISSIAADASPPERLASAILSFASFWRCAQLLELAAAARAGARRAPAARRSRPRRLGARALREPAPGRAVSPLGRAPGGLGSLPSSPSSEDFRPSRAVLLEELGDCVGLLAHDDVRRHDRAGEAAVADGEQHVVAWHLARVEVRAVRALAARDLALGLRALGGSGARACGSRCSAR